jgi:hypothetical protein
MLFHTKPCAHRDSTDVPCRAFSPNAGCSRRREATQTSPRQDRLLQRQALPASRTGGRSRGPPPCHAIEPACPRTPGGPHAVRVMMATDSMPQQPAREMDGARAPHLRNARQHGNVPFRLSGRAGFDSHPCRACSTRTRDRSGSARAQAIRSLPRRCPRPLGQPRRAHPQLKPAGESQPRLPAQAQHASRRWSVGGSLRLTPLFPAGIIRPNVLALDAREC